MSWDRIIGKWQFQTAGKLAFSWGKEYVAVNETAPGKLNKKRKTNKKFRLEELEIKRKALLDFIKAGAEKPEKDVPVDVLYEPYIVMKTIVGGIKGRISAMTRKEKKSARIMDERFASDLAKLLEKVPFKIRSKRGKLPFYLRLPEMKDKNGSWTANPFWTDVCKLVTKRIPPSDLARSYVLNRFGIKLSQDRLEKKLNCVEIPDPYPNRPRDKVLLGVLVIALMDVATLEPNEKNVKLFDRICNRLQKADYHYLQLFYLCRHLFDQRERRYPKMRNLKHVRRLLRSLKNPPPPHQHVNDESE